MAFWSLLIFFKTDNYSSFIIAFEFVNSPEEVQDLFNNKGAVINTKKSKTGKYVSVSIVLKVESSDIVISYYKKAEKIKGIISL